jgi:hypothetical protein
LSITAARPMNKFEAWIITICIVMAMLTVPASIYRWALLLLALPLVGLAIVFI